jgi:hypothetical protein
MIPSRTFIINSAPEALYQRMQAKIYHQPPLIKTALDFPEIRFVILIAPKDLFLPTFQTSAVIVILSAAKDLLCSLRPVRPKWVPHPRRVLVFAARVGFTEADPSLASTHPRLQSSRPDRNRRAP